MNAPAIDPAEEELSVEAVQKRFAWARNNGFATWLWPDIAVEDWRRATAMIVDATRRIVAGQSHWVLVEEDAAAVGLAAYVSGMGPILGFWLETGQLSATPAIRQQLHRHFLHTRARNAKLAEVAREVAGKLAEECIVPTILKGMHTAFVYFPNPGTRPVADIDIYIPRDQIAVAGRLFAGLGFQPIPRLREPYMCDWHPVGVRREPRTLTYVHQDDPWGLDILGSLNRPLPTGEQVRIDRFMPGFRGEDWPLSPKAQILPQPLLALHLCAHVSEDLHNVTLVRIFELVQVFRRDSSSGTLEWGAFLEGARAIGGGRFVLPALHFCEELAPGTVPSGVLEICRADAPAFLSQVLAEFSLSAVQPLGRHSLRQRFMWADTWRKRLSQIRREFGLDGQGKDLRTILYSYGTKMRGVLRGRLTA
jgi:hypothetical protein